MANQSPAHSRIANNRLAAAIVVGSVLAAALFGLLYWAGLLEFLVTERGPAADAIPLYLLIAFVVPVLVVWGWQRLLSWFS